MRMVRVYDQKPTPHVEVAASVTMIMRSVCRRSVMQGSVSSCTVACRDRSGGRDGRDTERVSLL